MELGKALIMMLISSISDVDWCFCKWVENRCRFRSSKWIWVGARATKINDFWIDCIFSPRTILIVVFKKLAGILSTTVIEPAVVLIPVSTRKSQQIQAALRRNWYVGSGGRKPG
jgi:hypothetical protein